MQNDQNLPVVIDNGSSNCRIGLSGLDSPQWIIPCLFGKPKIISYMIAHYKEYFVGDQAKAKRGILMMSNPIVRGEINDMDAMDKIWNHCILNQQRVLPEEHPILLSTSMYNSHSDLKKKQKILEIFFESFGVPKFYEMNRTKLSLYSTGRTTGLAIHSGDQTTQYLTINQSKITDNGLLNVPLGGFDITEYLGKLLSYQLDIHLTSTAQRQILKNVKQKICYSVIDMEHQIKSNNFVIKIFLDFHEQKAAPQADKSFEKGYHYELPDSNVIKIKDQCFRAPEIMFNPSIVGKDILGIHDNIEQLLNRMQEKEQLKKQMYKNIVLGGGNTLFKGMTQRLDYQLTKICPSGFIKKITAPLSRQNSSWIGGSILTSLSTFQQMWISQSEYKQKGPSALLQNSKWSKQQH